MYICKVHQQKYCHSPIITHANKNISNAGLSSRDVQLHQKWQL